MPTYRKEKDSMGEMKVPASALWGASTQRAVENFPVSGAPMPKRFIRALGLVKLAAAEVNRDLGLLDRKTAAAIAKAAREVASGKHDGHFPVDVFQTGSGTSSNMNANEVIATRASQILGAKVHPHDHVNLCQSSNDVVPTAMHVAALLAIDRDLLPALRRLRQALARKARAFADVVKIGRTHLMDATPITLGQEFSGWARQVELGIGRVERASGSLRELAIGGTAVGTGINAHPEFGRRVAERLTALAGTEFREAANHFEAQGAQDAYVEVAAALSTVAASLMKIANDLRLLASGPRAGLGEIKLPAVQPGSSIMPGKVNPVMCEMVVQVGAQVTGNSLVVTLGGQWGQLDLNTMLPVMTRNLLESVDLLANSSRLFADRCVAGIEADRARAETLIEGSTAMVTALTPVIGYDKAAKIAKEAFRARKTVRQLLKEKKVLSAKQIDALLDARSLTKPDAKRLGSGGG